MSVLIGSKLFALGYQQLTKVAASMERVKGGRDGLLIIIFQVINHIIHGFKYFLYQWTRQLPVERMAIG